MLSSKRILNLAPIGIVFRTVKPAAETNGQSLEMEWDLLPKADGTGARTAPKSRAQT
jgi:hypothetical protein